MNMGVSYFHTAKKINIVMQLGYVQQAAGCLNMAMESLVLLLDQMCQTFFSLSYITFRL